MAGHSGWDWCHIKSPVDGQRGPRKTVPVGLEGSPRDRRAVKGGNQSCTGTRVARRSTVTMGGEYAELTVDDRASGAREMLAHGRKLSG
jgi:hypothetical protein